VRDGGLAMPVEVITALIAETTALVGALAGALTASPAERRRLEADRERRSYERMLERSNGI
jgi:hypothetical protein